jgi:hypothetical protein
VLLGTYGEPLPTWGALGNLIGTQWRQQKNEKIPSHPMIQKENKLGSPNCMLIGCLIFLFPKLLVAIFDLG